MNNKSEENNIIISNSNNINLKHIFILMDEIITSSLNEGNIHFFITINFKENINKKKKLEKKIELLEKSFEKIETLSWYNIVSELNLNKNYHLHILIAVKSIIGYNNIMENNIKYFLINEYEIDTKLNVCWDFINIKKAWKYLYKELILKKNKKVNKKTIKKIKNEEFTLDPVFENGNYSFDHYTKNNNNFKNINVLKIDEEIENWFLKLKKEINISKLKKNNFFYIKGVKLDEKNYNERQLIFIWDFFLILNNMVINKNNIYTKIENSLISFKKFKEIDFLFDNINDIFFFLRKLFPFQFNNFDELNFISKFLKNKEEKIKRFKEFTKRQVVFNFNIMEFKDGIYSILFNKFIRKTKFEKNYNENLEKILIEKNVFTIKFYECSFENLKEPLLWLNSIEKVLGLKKRTNKLTDRIANFIKEDDREWLLIYIAYIFHYSTNELKKRNTLYIWGPSNTGKTTLIVNLFINYFGKENIGLISNNKNFEYQHIIDKKLLIFDEFDIDKINIDNFKKLLSKEMVLGEKKGKEPELIESKPILISSNYSLANKLNMDENKEAIINRLKTINFEEKIKNEDMDSNINKKLKEEEAKIIVYCNKIYFNKIKEGKKNRMDDIKFLEKL